MMTIIVSVLYAATLGLGVLYSIVSNNIVYMNSFLMYVIEIGLQLLEITLYSVAFAFFVCAIYRYEFRSSVPFLASYVLLTALYRVASLFFELLFSGAIGPDDVSSAIVYFVLDILIATLVVVISCFDFKHYRAYLKKWLKMKRLVDENATAPALYPFEKVFSKSNPLQVCAMKIAVLLSAFKIISRIIFDLYYGAPTTLSEALIMVVYYLSDLLLGVIAYTTMLAIFARLFKNKTES